MTSLRVPLQSFLTDDAVTCNFYHSEGVKSVSCPQSDLHSHLLKTKGIVTFIIHPNSTPEITCLPLSEGLQCNFP